MGVNSSFDEPRKRLRTRALSACPLGKQLPTSQPPSSNRPHHPDRRRLVMSQPPRPKPSSVSTNPHGKAAATTTRARNVHPNRRGASSPLPSKSRAAQKQHAELAPGHLKGRPGTPRPAKSHNAQKRAESVARRHLKDHQRTRQRSKDSQEQERPTHDVSDREEFTPVDVELDDEEDVADAGDAQVSQTYVAYPGSVLTWAYEQARSTSPD
jgi:hypothetical protein